MGNPFSGIGAEYDAWYETPLGAFVEETERALLLEVLAPRPVEVVADIGAGTGRLARYLAEHAGVHVVAVEPSASMREVGERETSALAVEWHEAVAEDLPLKDGSVDAALLVTVLEFLEDPARAIVEVRRVLRPHGRLVVGVLSALSAWGALYRQLADEHVQPWASARFWTPSSLGGLLDLADRCVGGSLFLAPNAEQPYPEADAAGRRAGNEPAFLVARWEKT